MRVRFGTLLGAALVVGAAVVYFDGGFGAGGSEPEPLGLSPDERGDSERNSELSMPSEREPVAAGAGEAARALEPSIGVPRAEFTGPLTVELRDGLLLCEGVPVDEDLIDSWPASVVNEFRSRCFPIQLEALLGYVHEARALGQLQFYSREEFEALGLDDGVALYAPLSLRPGGGEQQQGFVLVPDHAAPDLHTLREVAGFVAGSPGFQEYMLDQLLEYEARQGLQQGEFDLDVDPAGTTYTYTDSAGALVGYKSFSTFFSM